jgi:hypothetical protein
VRVASLRTRSPQSLGERMLLKRWGSGLVLTSSIAGMRRCFRSGASACSAPCYRPQTCVDRDRIVFEPEPIIPDRITATVAVVSIDFADLDTAVSSIARSRPHRAQSCKGIGISSGIIFGLLAALTDLQPVDNLQFSLKNIRYRFGALKLYPVSRIRSWEALLTQSRRRVHLHASNANGVLRFAIMCGGIEVIAWVLKKVIVRAG